MPPRSVSSRSLAWLLFAALLASTLPLAAGVAQTARLAELATAGEGVRWRDEVHQGLRSSPPPPTDETLRRILSSRAGRGLRYIALVGADGVVHARAGEESVSAPLRCDPARVGRVARAGGRARVCAGPLPPRRREPFESGPSRPHRRPPSLVLEFDDRAGADLATAQSRVVFSGGIALVTLLLLGLHARRLLRQREEAALGIERARHLAQLGEMSAVLAHEIRNPLASLKGHAQLLAERVGDSERLAPQAARVVSEAQRLERLITELLSFARTGALDRREVDPARWARESLAGFEVSIIDHGAPTRCTLDPKRLGEALRNLVQNAIEAGGGAELQIDEEDGALSLRVLDRGPGIAEGEEEAVFEPFHTRKSRGTGLGLAIARRTVALHGGTLTARRRDGGGAAFELRVPLR